MDGRCPACRDGRSRIAAVVRGLRFRRCHSCGSLFAERRPPDRALHSLYDGEGYFARRRLGPPRPWGYQDYLRDRAHIERKFDGVLDRLERHVKPGRLLDVGAGPGFMVSRAAQRGWSARGLDVNGWAVRYARSHDVDVRPGTLADERVEGDDRFDAVTMMDLLEHVPDPGAAVAQAAKITRPGGALAVLTPDAGAPLGRLLGRRWPELTRAPAHLVLFSAAGLSRLLGRHGYQVLGAHSVGKTSTLSTLVCDAAPAAPWLAGLARPVLERTRLADRTATVDLRTKVCMYARLVASPGKCCG